MYQATIGGERHNFPDLARLMACASAPRSGDALAQIARTSEAMRVAAQFALPDLPLRTFLNAETIAAVLLSKISRGLRRLRLGHDSQTSVFFKSAV